MSALTQYLNEIKNNKVLTKEEELELARKAQAGNEHAKNKLITANLRFVVSVAKQYQGQGIQLEDLIGEGNLGLMKALDRFDTSKSFKFITYAVWWIRQSIINAIHENARLIRLPANKIGLVGKINKIKSSLEQTLGRDPSFDELHHELQQHEIFDDINSLLFHYVDIDKKTEEGTNIHEIIPSSDDPPSTDVEREYLTDDILDILKDFTEREQQIIKMYFGIGEIRNYTLEEVGDDFGLTRERIRQIKKQVIEKLQMNHRKTKLQIHMQED
jgi:RNA polymerase primary sigma factor